jgi:hypothetical protein
MLQCASPHPAQLPYRPQSTLCKVLQKGDIVLCKVNGSQYLHLIKHIQGDRYQIGNNIGKINGWIGIGSIYVTDPGLTDNPVEAAFRQELMIRLVTLPGKLRLVFNLCVIDGYAPAQAAGLLGITERRLEKYLSQARSLLRLPVNRKNIF